jgi:dTDP-4-amino-4,6-dideoxygalactose transaminase
VIPILDLKAQYRSIRQEIDAAVMDVLDSTQFILGDQVTAFEREFAGYAAAGETVAMNSGTSALHLALLAAGIGAGDEVITVPFTFVATVSAITYTGATPVLVDVDPVYLTMDPDAIERAITPRTKAIMPVHLYGQPADMDPILAIARKHNLIVLEDAAQAHGAEYRGRRCGSMGELAAFSFYPGKNLGAYGEGGAAVTSDPGYAKTMRMLRDWGQAKKYEHTLKGFNARMDGMQGAILRVKLRHMEAWTESRRSRAALYDTLLGAGGLDAGGPDGAPLRTPVRRPDCRHVFHCYTVRTPWRDRLVEHLRAQHIGTGIHYPIPVHLQPAHADLGYGRGDFPNSERAAAEVLSLPLYPELTDDQVRTVAAAVLEGAATLAAK